MGLQPHSNGSLPTGSFGGTADGCSCSSRGSRTGGSARLEVLESQLRVQTFESFFRLNIQAAVFRIREAAVFYCAFLGVRIGRGLVQIGQGGGTGPQRPGKGVEGGALYQSCK